MDYNKIREIKLAYKNGVNIIDFLKRKADIDYNTEEIIEFSYDLQAGSYVDFAMKNENLVQIFCKECAPIIKKHISNCSSIADVGTGELTTLSHVLLELAFNKTVYAFDISWSRLSHGRKFAQSVLDKNMLNNLKIFSAEMSAIPIMDSAIDLVLTFHALEPNGGNEKKLLSELFRIAKNKVILFEPSYELNSQEGRNRMDKLGYIRNLPDVIKDLGGELLEVSVIKSAINALNPTTAYVISLKKELISRAQEDHRDVFAYPGTNNRLILDGDHYFSPDHGVSFPIISGIPIFRKKNGILTTSKMHNSEIV